MTLFIDIFYNICSFLLCRSFWLQHKRFFQRNFLSTGYLNCKKQLVHCFLFFESIRMQRRLCYTNAERIRKQKRFERIQLQRLYYFLRFSKYISEQNNCYQKWWQCNTLFQQSYLKFCMLVCITCCVCFGNCTNSQGA